MIVVQVPGTAVLGVAGVQAAPAPFIWTATLAVSRFVPRTGQMHHDPPLSRRVPLSRDVRPDDVCGRTHHCFKQWHFISPHPRFAGYAEYQNDE